VPTAICCDASRALPPEVAARCARNIAEEIRVIKISKILKVSSI
jgi:hypothetical protein